MNKLTVFSLKAFRKIYLFTKRNDSTSGRNWKMFSQKDYANDLIYKTLKAEKPCMIGRFGSTELACITNFKGINNRPKVGKYLKYIKGETPAWWWEISVLNNMHIASGFFPPEIDKIKQFCEMMIRDMEQVDILGSWLLEERLFNSELIRAKRVVLEDLEPFFASTPWTRALEEKKVLVVHPFAKTIEKQYLKRELLFENNLLPQFELKTIKAVQSIAGQKTEYSDWFEALDSMKKQIDAMDYDICIIGAGAYGFPLAAHVKRKGKKAIHLAGVTQLLFGIKGQRWENYIVWPYMNLFNEHWVRPAEEERPENAQVVEGACYW